MPPRVLVTTRAGGSSRAPYAGNNLALHVGDDPAAVGANRQRLATQLGVPAVRFLNQVHGATVALAEAAPSPAGVEPTADAVVTATPGVAVAVLVADCVPVAVTGRTAVAVIHAGRQGIVEGVVAAGVAALRRLDPGPLAATVGPSICARCYEVPASLQAAVGAVVPAAIATSATGTPALDLPAAVRAELAALDVEVPAQPHLCTREDDRFYSYRRDGVTGRFAMVALVQP